MQQQGKFLLFRPDELSKWLDQNNFTRTIRLIQNHHTEIPCYAEFRGNNHFQLLVEMEESHIERKFDEIAQNLTTFPDGSIAVCRSFEKDPAGIRGANSGAICIENLGNFDSGKDSLTVEQRKTIVALNAALCHKFKLFPDTNTVVYHHWYDRVTGERTNGTGVTKTCPGTAFFGGNSVEAARAGFIPLIVRALSLLNPGAGPLYPDSPSGK